MISAGILDSNNDESEYILDDDEYYNDIELWDFIEEEEMEDNE